MKLLNKKLITVLLIALLGCKSNEPSIYTSISGVWRCEEYVQSSGTRVYMVEIARSNSNIKNFHFFNFHNIDENESAIAELNGSNLRFNSQNIGISAVKLVSGNGLVASDLKRIELSYNIFDGTSDLNASVILTRK